jgi:hypothetical protein
MSDTITIHDSTTDRTTTGSDPAAAPEVEVWCAYTARWVRGFRLAGTTADGMVILLGRDRETRLPVEFSPDVVRPASTRPRGSGPAH